MNSKGRALTVEPIVRSRMPELDTIRGIAVLSVFAFHSLEHLGPSQSSLPRWEMIPIALAYQGWAGVNLFFLLSGFLITGILLNSRYSGVRPPETAVCSRTCGVMVGVRFLLMFRGPKVFGTECGRGRSREYWWRVT